MGIVDERVHVLRDMSEDEHVEKAYRLMAADGSYEREAINATLAVAHLLLAERKQRDPRSTAWQLPPGAAGGSRNYE